MLEDLSLESFTPHVGDPFSIEVVEGKTVKLTLQEVKPLGSQPAAESESARGRPPFSLLFAGPAKPPLDQRIYRLEHAGLGSLEIFIVPVGLGEGGRLYEAVFN